MDSDVLDRKFINALNKCSERYNSIKENYPQSLTWFKNFVTATLIMSVERMTKLEDEVEANKIQDSLMDYYADEIEERWNELQEFGIRESITRILREETELPTYFRRRIDMETLEQIYQFVLKLASKRYTDNKKRLNAMTPYKFNHMVTSNLIEDVCDNFELECGDDENRFNQLWDFLNDRYSKRNIKHFYEIR